MYCDLPLDLLPFVLFVRCCATRALSCIFMFNFVFSDIQPRNKVIYFSLGLFAGRLSHHQYSTQTVSEHFCSLNGGCRNVQHSIWQGNYKTRATELRVARKIIIKDISDLQRDVPVST